MIASFTEQLDQWGDTILLQNDLNTLEAWGVKWKMFFHPGKGQHLRITNKKKIIPAQYNFLCTGSLEMPISYMIVVIFPN